MIPDDLDVRHAYATVNGLRMHYVEKGAGPLVVLLHGFPEMWWSWRYQIPALVDAGLPRRRARSSRVQRHRGEGAVRHRHAPRRRRSRSSITSGADKAILVAHDWGGGLAWHLASTRQARCARARRA